VGPEVVPARMPTDLGRMQALLSEALLSGGPGYALHPGELAWWVHHADPRTSGGITYWWWEDRAWLVLDTGNDEFAVFARGGRRIEPLLEWAQRRLSGKAAIGSVSTTDTGLEAILGAVGYRPARGVMPLFVRRIDGADEGSPTRLPSGWTIRPVAGEHEADRRRAASHAAFRSTMTADEHLQRYLCFMRSPVYDAERDLVAVSPEGRIGAFLIWWPDAASGVAQLEPVGTDPQFQRLGLGRALISEALGRMRSAGMATVRVCTDDHRTEAMAFYPAVGFTRVADLRWWTPG
jgi:ribosomal protein S18 acetylase RimI-like enzyme